MKVLITNHWFLFLIDITVIRNSENEFTWSVETIGL